MHLFGGGCSKQYGNHYYWFQVLFSLHTFSDNLWGLPQQVFHQSDVLVAQ